MHHAWRRNTAPEVATVTFMAFSPNITDCIPQLGPNIPSYNITTVINASSRLSDAVAFHLRSILDDADWLFLQFSISLTYTASISLLNVVAEGEGQKFYYSKRYETARAILEISKQVSRIQTRLWIGWGAFAVSACLRRLACSLIDIGGRPSPRSYFGRLLIEF